jgi:RHS repeat-associated protein
MLLSEDSIDKGFFPYEPGSQCGMIHNDHLSTPQKMTDATGAVVWAADYKPFGEATLTVSTITNNLRFPGQYYDAETALLYNFARTYNPAFGRYIESDPLGIEAGKNHIYVYVENDPIMNSDPWGLMGAKGDNPAGKPQLFIPPSKLPCGKTPDKYCEETLYKKMGKCLGNSGCMMRVREWGHLCVMWATGCYEQPEK